MDTFQLRKEFVWIKKVLLSSETNEHITCSLKLFNNFMSKWDVGMSKPTKKIIQDNFDNIYIEHSEKIEKGG